ncbi:uncharacterized protein [Antedon mediterranea]|uniref:uncharacterized protein isoform X1 n=1 Tax=Antedon mediterranea TaxID=105859 RepID=UPI003AF99E57
MPLISSEQPRPPSDQLVDLHVYVVPPSAWNEQYRSVFNQAVNETISAGFVRVHPEDPLYKLRENVEEQLGNDVIPDEYVFLRSVGRCFTQVKGKQEINVKVKHFLPPYNFSAEIFVLKSRREAVPLPEINGGKGHLLERKYSQNEGTQTTQSPNSGYHSDDWPANHVIGKSTELGAVKSPNKKRIGLQKKVPIKKGGPKGISKKGAIALGSSMQQNGKISGKQFREVTNRRPEKKRLATARVIGKIGTNKDRPPARGGTKVTENKMSRPKLGVKLSSEVAGRRVSGIGRGGSLVPVKRQGVDRQNGITSLEGRKRQSVVPHTRLKHGPTAPNSSHQPSNQEHVKPIDKSGWRDTYTNGTNEDSGIAEPTPEEGDLEFSRQLHNPIERHDVNSQSENRQMIVVDHNQEEPHRTEQRRRPHDEDDFHDSSERKRIQEFQSRYDQFLEDEENRKEFENLEKIREQNAQNMIDIRQKREMMEMTMAQRAQDLALSNGNNQYDELESSERASKEVSQFGDNTALSEKEQGHTIDEQRDLNHEQWSNGQAPALTEKELLQQFQRDEADKNRRALEAIQIDDSNKEHSFLKRGQKRGVPSAVKNHLQETSIAIAVPQGKTPRPAQHANIALKSKDHDQLLADLEEMREQRQAIEQRREELVRKAKLLQSRTVEKRNKARDYWKKQYFEAKKQTSPHEETINKLRQQVEGAHRKLMAMMEGRIQQKKVPPSQKNNHKINIAKGQHDLEDLRRRVENAKMRLTSEMKLRNQAEKELRILKNELTQKKIHVTLTRSQQLAILKESEEGLLSSRTPHSYMTPVPRRTPVAPNHLRQSTTSHP